MAMAIPLRGMKGFGKGKRPAAHAAAPQRGLQEHSASDASFDGVPPSSVAHQARSSDFDSSAQAPVMPLAFVSPGDKAVVSAIRGSKEAKHHLENLGFVEGAHVSVVCETAGNLIVEVKGSQVALDRHIAMKVSARI